MPPKPGSAASGKKPGTAGTAPPAGPPPLDPEQEAERRVLIEQCKILKAQKIQEESMVAQFTEEKLRLNQMWIMAKQELEERRAGLRAKEREREDQATQQKVEVGVYQQRIKQLLLEQQLATTDARTEGVVAVKLAQDVHRHTERDLKHDRTDLKAVLREMEASHEEFMKALRMEQDAIITDLRLQFERRSRELQALYEDKMARARDELTRDREEELKAIETRKAKHIGMLISSHEKAFADIKGYYNEVTHANLDLIKSLKEEVEELKHREAADEKMMFSIAQENKRMSEPMRKALDDVKRLRAEREAYRRDLIELTETKAAVLVTQDRLENLRWETDVLDRRLERVQAERDALYKKFRQAVLDVRQKAGLRALLLEKRAAAAEEETERETVALAEVLGAAGMQAPPAGDPRAAPDASRLQALVAAKDSRIAALQEELTRVAEAHDSTLDDALHKLAGYGIPADELGFRPLRSIDVLRGIAPRNAGPSGEGLHGDEGVHGEDRDDGGSLPMTAGSRRGLVSGGAGGASTSRPATHAPSTGAGGRRSGDVSRSGMPGSAYDSVRAALQTGEDGVSGASRAVTGQGGRR